ncbi:MAG: integrase arm-type DNA-binding domain-containing protein, partial [Acetobacteraceae bacterium]|nr:integrase arm-type DNA-binding domain-containing protein [Acetobacteraceae bacterium]
MATRLTDTEVRKLSVPASGNQIVYDTDVKGFGLRITSSGARAFVLNYRIAGRERRITIGSYPDWTTSGARDECKSLKRRIDRGEDPLAEREQRMAAPTINDLCDLFADKHLSKRRATTAAEYLNIIKVWIRPEIGAMKTAELRHTDVERLHRKIAKTRPYRANRTIAVLSKMMSLAVKWELRSDNPVRGIERAPEEKRSRFLTPGEIGRLAEVLAVHPEKNSCNAI